MIIRIRIVFEVEVRSEMGMKEGILKNLPKTSRINKTNIIKRRINCAFI